MRTPFCLLLCAGLLAAGCDKQDAPGGGYLDELAGARARARQLKSAANLKSIVVGMYQAVTLDRKSGYPTLKALVDKRIIGNPQAFLVPGSGSKPAAGRVVSDYDSLPDRAGFPVRDGAPPSGLLLAWEKKAFFKDGRNVAFVDGSGRFVPEPEFAGLLEALDAWVAENKP